MSEQATRVFLIRHALNDWVGSRLAGWTPGVHLNDKGKAQAEALAGRLSGETLAAVYSSPLERAVETAQALANPRMLPVQIVEELGEVRCGDWTGQAIEELSKTDLWRQVQFYPSGFRFPGGESMAEMQGRAVGALANLIVAHVGQTIAVVSHADVLKAVVAYATGLHLDLFQRLVIDPASITELVYTPYGPRLIRCNDTAHLPREPKEEKQETTEQTERAETSAEEKAV